MVRWITWCITEKVFSQAVWQTQNKRENLIGFSLFMFSFILFRSNL